MAKAKEIAGLDCVADALAGIKLVLMTRLEEMVALRAKALDWSDIEGVHDMRVASRRLRSALYDFRPYLRVKLRQRRLRLTARALGRVRDEDVTIEALQKLAPEVPEDIAPGLGYVINEHMWRRERARAMLEKVLSERRLARMYERLLSRFEQATASAPPVREERAARPDDAVSFRRAGVEIIEARLKELYDLGESLYHPYDVERLHDMRIAAKRLRYAMELFSQCWGERLAPFSHDVAKMQGWLGDLHDCDVWIENLSRRLREKYDAEVETAYGPALRAASLWLLQHFTKERGKHYRHALTRWREWLQEDFSLRLRETLSEEAEKKEDSHPAASSLP